MSFQVLRRIVKLAVKKHIPWTAWTLDELSQHIFLALFLMEAVYKTTTKQIIFSFALDQKHFDAQSRIFFGACLFCMLTAMVDESI